MSRIEKDFYKILKERKKYKMREYNLRRLKRNKHATKVNPSKLLKIALKLLENNLPK